MGSYDKLAMQMARIVSREYGFTRRTFSLCLSVKPCESCNGRVSVTVGTPSGSRTKEVQEGDASRWRMACRDPDGVVVKHYPIDEKLPDDVKRLFSQVIDPCVARKTCSLYHEAGLEDIRCAYELDAGNEGAAWPARQRVN